eukprot:m.29909 g.29909  ORF g.29909 m.29909 type:complete len:103 (+) comp16177_c0_seq1:2293-2601(+)
MRCIQNKTLGTQPTTLLQLQSFLRTMGEWFSTDIAIDRPCNVALCSSSTPTTFRPHACVLGMTSPRTPTLPTYSCVSCQGYMLTHEHIIRTNQKYNGNVENK